MLLIATSLAGVVVAAVVALSIGYRTSSAEGSLSVAVPEPPALERVVDPAVRKLLTESRAAVSRRPQSATAWGNLGMAFFIHDFFDEARRCFGVAEQLDRRDPRWPYFQATIAAATDLDGAVREFQRAADLCAEVPDAPRLQLGELLLTHGHIPEAAEQFERLLQRSPAHARAHLGLARVAFLKGELAESQQHLDLSIRDRRTQKAAYLLLAQVRARLGDPSGAEKAQRTAAAQPADPAWPDPYFDEARQLQTGMKTALIRVNELLEQGRLDACIAQCRKLLHDAPDSAMLWLTLGNALVQKRELPAAQEALEKVLRLTPDSAPAHFQLGFLAYLGKDYRTAATWYRKATELKPDFTFAYHDLGHCLMLLGDRTGAIQAFRAALQCQPDLAGVHRTLSELLIKENQQAEAFTHACLAYRLNPVDPAARQLVQRLLVRVHLPIGP